MCYGLINSENFHFSALITLFCHSGSLCVGFGTTFSVLKNDPKMIPEMYIFPSFCLEKRARGELISIREAKTSCQMGMPR